MSVVDVKVPGVGESVQEGMIESWHKSSGDIVEQDEIILELETDKATVEVAAEVAGKLEILVEAGQTVKVGDVIARIDTSAQGSAVAKKPQNIEEKPEEKEALDPGPAVGRMAKEENIDLTKVSGSGRGGRVTKEDLLKSPASKEESKPVQKKPEPIAPEISSERQETVESMSMLRRKIAERLLDSQKNAAILTTFNEVDMSAILEMRKKYKDDFLKEHQVKLGFMGFFLKASVVALQKFPRVNAYIKGTDILYHNYCDIGVAVSTEKGLMVPVIRDVNTLSIAGIEKQISLFAEKARANKISLDDLQGGTFTVSNGGVFGSLLSTPIINPPQSAILGMHKTQMRAVVMEDGQIKARPMMYLALSYDHRIVDGKEAVGFLVRIKECLEDPCRFVLGV
jgi:2-oxoglutarate dehydrogenase E2 component (dihydrolipoamide succinyltransferase)